MRIRWRKEKSRKTGVVNNDDVSLGAVVIEATIDRPESKTSGTSVIQNHLLDQDGTDRSQYVFDPGIRISSEDIFLSLVKGSIMLLVLGFLHGMYDRPKNC